MLTPDAPLYIKPRLDPALWRWLLRFAARCNARDWRAARAAKSALLNDSRARLARLGRAATDWTASSSRTGVDYVFRDPRAFEHCAAGMRRCCASSALRSRWSTARPTRALEPALKPGVAGAVRFSGDARAASGPLRGRTGARGARARRHHRRALRVAGAGRPAATACALRTAAGARMRAAMSCVALGAWSPRLARAIACRPEARRSSPARAIRSPIRDPPWCRGGRWCCSERSVCVTAWGSGFRLGSTMEFSGFDDTPQRRAGWPRWSAARAEYLHEPVGAAGATSAGTAGGR